MPGFVVHLVCAERVLQRWRAEPIPAPFGLDDPSVVEAFLQGAIAPDMGFFVKGNRRISELAHRTRSADLARALVRSARTPVERAYAWGWVTHLLADISVHPLINATAGKIVHGDTDRPLAPSDDPGLHLRIELGLDARFRDRLARSSWPLMRPVLTRWNIRFVARAYRDVHNRAVRASDLLAAHRAISRAASAVLALFSSVALPASPRELVNQTVSTLEGLPDHFFAHYTSGLNDFENHDLDLGIVQPRHAVAPTRTSPAIASYLIRDRYA
jgi:hypothetical protein